MKFELLQKHSRQVKLILYFLFFDDKNFDNFVHKTQKHNAFFTTQGTTLCNSVVAKKHVFHNIFTLI
jgi:hypothetical protein